MNIVFLDVFVSGRLEKERMASPYPQNRIADAFDGVMLEPTLIRSSQSMMEFANPLYTYGYINNSNVYSLRAAIATSVVESIYGTIRAFCTTPTSVVSIMRLYVTIINPWLKLGGTGSDGTVLGEIPLPLQMILTTAMNVDSTTPEPQTVPVGIDLTRTYYLAFSEIFIPVKFTATTISPTIVDGRPIIIPAASEVFIFSNEMS